MSDTQRMTVIVPEALARAADHAMVALGTADAADTYRAPSHQDGQGRLYALSSGAWTQAQIAGIQDPAILDSQIVTDRFAAFAQRAGAADPAAIAAIVADCRAQAAIARQATVVWDGVGAVPPATPGTIIVLPSASPAEARAQIAAAGLSPLTRTI